MIFVGFFLVKLSNYYNILTDIEQNHHVIKLNKTTQFYLENVTNMLRTWKSVSSAIAGENWTSYLQRVAEDGAGTAWRAASSLWPTADGSSPALGFGALEKHHLGGLNKTNHPEGWFNEPRVSKTSWTTENLPHLYLYLIRQIDLDLNVVGL